VKEHGYDSCIVSENIVTVYSSAGFTTEELARQSCGSIRRGTDIALSLF
jgi:hypothetical protein